MLDYKWDKYIQKLYIKWLEQWSHTHNGVEGEELRVVFSGLCDHR